jgi:hypothetical protein
LSYILHNSARSSATYKNQQDVANQLNHHFINVGPSLADFIENTNVDPISYINNSPSTSFIMSPVNETNVSLLFSQLNSNKTSLDIPNKLIKIACRPLAVPFTLLYNESIAKGSVPEVLKISKVIPIYKNGITTESNNYRPISILSPFSKVFERLIYDQILTFIINKHNIYLKTAIDNKLYICGIFLDFSKGFRYSKS